MEEEASSSKNEIGAEIYLSVERFTRNWKREKEFYLPVINIIPSFALALPFELRAANKIGFDTLKISNTSHLRPEH